MANVVANSYNIIIDTERCLNSRSDGDSIYLSLNQTPIECADNQYIRLSLQNFSMYKSHTNVNPNNNMFRITHDGATPQNDLSLYLPPANYSSLNDISSTFANILAEQLKTDIGGISFTVNNILPVQSGTTDNIISFTIKFSSNHGITNLLLRTLVTDGDSFEILGTNRIKQSDSASINSLKVDLSDPTEVRIQCLYNGQLSSQQNVYLRTDAHNTNIQTESYVSLNNDTGSSLSSSAILGRMIIDNDFIVFNTSTSDEYSVSLAQRRVTQLRLYITDSHSRSIPENVKYVNNIPVSTQQKRLGNRSFECVIKVDIMQRIHSHNNLLDTGPLYPALPTYDRPIIPVPFKFGNQM